jgi:hypothetical protein
MIASLSNLLFFIIGQYNDYVVGSLIASSYNYYKSHIIKKKAQNYYFSPSARPPAPSSSGFIVSGSPATPESLGRQH